MTTPDEIRHSPERMDIFGAIGRYGQCERQWQAAMPAFNEAMAKVDAVLITGADQRAQIDRLTAFRDGVAALIRDDELLPLDTVDEIGVLVYRSETDPLTPAPDAPQEDGR